MTCTNDQCESTTGFSRQTVHMRTPEEIRYARFWEEIELPKELKLTAKQYKEYLGEEGENKDAIADGKMSKMRIHMDTPSRKPKSVPTLPLTVLE